jgi:RNA polymerase sigma-70 factor (ECF subfamily)
VFRELREFLTGQNGERTYADVAPRLKLTEEAARAAVSRLRKRYQAILREEISQTVATGDEVEDELRQLFAAVAT